MRFQVVRSTSGRTGRFGPIRDGGEGPPRLSYEVGVLEDQESQREICAILEGGSDAFRQRERRYAVAFRGELGSASV